MWQWAPVGRSKAPRSQPREAPSVFRQHAHWPTARVRRCAQPAAVPLAEQRGVSWRGDGVESTGGCGVRERNGRGGWEAGCGGRAGPAGAGKRRYLEALCGPRVKVEPFRAAATHGDRPLSDGRATARGCRALLACLHIPYILGRALRSPPVQFPFIGERPWGCRGRLGAGSGAGASALAKMCAQLLVCFFVEIIRSIERKVISGFGSRT